MISNTGTAELKAFAERIEALEVTKDEILEDIKQVYGEAKDAGFTVKILRRVVRERKMDPSTRREENDLFELYWGAVNGELFDDIPASPPEAVAAKAANKGRKSRAKAATVALKAADDFEQDQDPLTVGGITYLTAEGADAAREEMGIIGGPTEDEQAFA